MILFVAALGFAAAALVSLTLRYRELGPHLEEEPEEVRAALRNVVKGMATGVRHIWERVPARDGLLTIGGHRVLFGISTLLTMLLYNNTFTGGGVAGIAGFSVAAGLLALGFFLGAVATPAATARISESAWIAALLASAAAALLLFGLPFSAALFPVAAFVLGFVSQAVKVTVDTLVQRHVDDAFRGRVFSVYDVLFNATFVLGAGLTAGLVPQSGVSVPVVGGMVLAYLLMSAAWTVRARRLSRSHRIRRCLASRPREPDGYGCPLRGCSPTQRGAVALDCPLRGWGRARRLGGPTRSRLGRIRWTAYWAARARARQDVVGRYSQALSGTRRQGQARCWGTGPQEYDESDPTAKTRPLHHLPAECPPRPLAFT